MFSHRRFCLLAVFAATLLLCLPVRGQEADRQRPLREDSTPNRLAEPSELAKENLGRVAASPAQVKLALAKDPGLLVELKRWVAKEATDNGQIIDDVSLSDDSIFDRIDRDLAFRSIATRLLQRYGYLLPNVNPDSPIGKEQELLLKERARRLVQVEAQEDSESLKPKDDEDQSQGMQRTACDQQDPRNQQQNCGQPQSSRRARSNSRQQESPDSQPNPPSYPDDQSPSNNPRMLRAGADRDTSDFQNDPDTQPGLTLASDPSRRPPDSLTGNLPAGSRDGLSNPSRPNALDESLPSSTSRRGTRPGTDMTSDRGPIRNDRYPSDRDFAREMAKDLPSVSMVHKRNPYADVPALYDRYVQAASRERDPERFGLEIFRNGTRQPDVLPMDLPVGPDYVVGPGDGLAIDLWGGVSQRLVRVVDREGRIALPESGPLLVSGHTLGEVQQSVQQVLRTQFRDASADVSLSRLRTIRVYIVGEVLEPGAYDVSSLSTPLNALFAAGGVTARGSLRKLQHYRGKQLLDEVDAYDLLLRGVGSDLQRLENGDSLLVPSLGAQVTVTGMVRRPAIYELHGENSLADVLDLAGGILPAAALQHIEVQRLEAHEKRTMLTVDVSAKGDPSSATDPLNAFKIQDGDQIHIFPIAPYNDSAIYLQGHVLRPGRYSFHDGMKLADVVASYADLLPEPSGSYAEIVRLNPPDYRPSVESFDLSAAMSNPAAAPKLQPLDTIRIFSKYDFELPPAVWVGGDVHSPGSYRTSGQAHFRDAIYLAGGLLPDAALNTAQLFRTESDGTMKILSVNLGAALSGNPIDNLLLQPRDRILVHRNATRVDPPTIDVKGEVAKPGRYPLTTNMHIEDLLRVAGGLKRSADPVRADLTRYPEGDAPQATSAQNLPVQLSAAMSGDTPSNLLLRDGDVLTVRASPGLQDIGATATLRGEVQHPGSYGIRPGEKLSSVLQRAGGFSPEAYPYGAVLLRREIRELEMSAYLQLIERVKVEEANLKALPETDADLKTAKLAAISETENTLTRLDASTPIGRLVIHIQPNVNSWKNTSADIPMRKDDVLIIPKKANYVVVGGQVFNPTAVSYRPGRSAKWYLSQSGGYTAIADKKAVFVIRGDGSVLSSLNHDGGWFSGDPLSTVLKPGDSIVVPEKAPKIGNRNWATLFQTAQVASSVALAVAYIHP
jgi:protein involved in polysaccharide export with SLBB domain